jgi:hypothetical protein
MDEVQSPSSYDQDVLSFRPLLSHNFKGKAYRYIDCEREGIRPVWPKLEIDGPIAFNRISLAVIRPYAKSHSGRISNPGLHIRICLVGYNHRTTAQ